MSTEKIAFWVALGIVLVTVLVVVFTGVTMILWNEIVPDITKGRLTEITFWQAMCLNGLAYILFSGSPSFSGWKKEEHKR